MPEDPQKPVTLKALLALEADRPGDPTLVDENGRLADWLQDPTHPDRIHAVKREKQIARIEKRLDTAKQKLELDWDTSS